MITALTVVALLGGTGTVSLPADKKVAELETDLAQYQQYDQNLGNMRELEWVERAISRLQRDIAWWEAQQALSPNDQATLNSLRLELSELIEYRKELKTELRGG